MTKHPENLEALAKIGRPGIGGEFLRMFANGMDRYELRRFRQMSACHDEPRQMSMGDLPASTMVYDLLSAIEGIVRHAQENEVPLHWDDHGLIGNKPSLRERLEKLSKI